MRELKKRLAKILIERSYREGDFTLASGRKSDYYFDCRQTALHPEGSWLIGTLFNELLADLDIRAWKPLHMPHGRSGHQGHRRHDARRRPADLRHHCHFA